MFINLSIFIRSPGGRRREYYTIMILISIIIVIISSIITIVSSSNSSSIVIISITTCMLKLFTPLDLCVSSLRRGHANLLCIVPI